MYTFLLTIENQCQSPRTKYYIHDNTGHWYTKSGEQFRTLPSEIVYGLSIVLLNVSILLCYYEL